MEEDRFQHNSKLYIICMVCMLLSLILFAFSFYILPNFLWGWFYDMPGFIFSWIEYLRENYNYTTKAAKLLIFFSFFISAIITGIICFVTSNTIENKIHTMESKIQEKTVTDENDFQETVSFTLQVIMMILLVIVLVFFVEWLIASPPAELI